MDPNSFSSSMGKLLTSPAELSWKIHESPTATDSQLPFSVKHVPRRVAKAPSFLFSSAYQGSFLESTVRRQILAAFFTAEKKRSSGGSSVVTNIHTSKLAHKRAKELSVAPSEIAMLDISVSNSVDEPTDGRDISVSNSTDKPADVCDDSDASS